MMMWFNQIPTIQIQISISLKAVSYMKYLILLDLSSLKRVVM